MTPTGSTAPESPPTGPQLIATYPATVPAPATRPQEPPRDGSDEPTAQRDLRRAVALLRLEARARQRRPLRSHRL
jgi:hypothetical protein